MSAAACGAAGAVGDALAVLGIRRLALAIHDASLPGDALEDGGRGSPGSDEARRFFAFVRQLGFDAVQLGPQGETGGAGHPSPYDATWFSREVLSIAWQPFARGDHGPFPLGADELAALAGAPRGGDPQRVDHRAVYERQHRILDRVHERFRAARARGDAAASALAARLEAFARAQHAWLDRHAEHDALGAADRGEQAARIERYALGQLFAHEQHAALRRFAGSIGLRLLGDVQIGASARELRAWPETFLPGYRLGAPPSRTNPEGQPWGYPVLHPGDSRAGARAVPAIFLARLGKLWDEFDGLRLDHPHGLIDPWVYRADDPDPLHAVQHGARLFATPADPAHPALARFAIARADDLDRRRDATPWAEDRVARLDAAQVARYATVLDALVELARARGRATADVACEVLSTLPFPVARVLERHRLGRFRVTQKASLDDPRDVYRSENAKPEDWIMVGTHDTRPIWRLAGEWLRDGSAAARARRVAERLAPEGAERARLVAEMSGDAGALARGHLAELFASPARQVMIFFADAFGLEETYNEPGTVSDRNWSLRLPGSWRRDYAERVAGGRALDLPGALALALRARGLAREHAGLAARLERESAALRR